MSVNDVFITQATGGSLGFLDHTKYSSPSTSVIGVCPVATVVGVSTNFFKEQLNPGAGGCGNQVKVELFDNR